MNPEIPKAASSPSVSGDLAVAVLAPIGRDADLACAILRGAQMEPAPCGTPQRLFERIAGGCGAALVASEALSATEAARLAALLDAQPEWSDPPLIVLLGHDGLLPHLQRLAQRSHTTLLHRPTRRVTLTTAARTAVESRRRQYALRDLLQSLNERTRQLQQLSLELTEAEERVRRHLAETLHDDLQQVLVGAHYRLGLLSADLNADGAGEAVNEVAELLKQAIATSRELSHELSPPALFDGGLGTALKWLAQRMQRLHGLTVSVSAAPEADPPTHTLKAFMFRCAQELLFNVVKHAAAHRATVRLTPCPQGSRLTVRDGGLGFELDTIQKGFGLLGIVERADVLGGKLQIASVSGKGTTVTLILPWQAANTPPALAHHARQGLRPCRG